MSDTTHEQPELPGYRDLCMRLALELAGMQEENARLHLELARARLKLARYGDVDE